jgi:hypothetical protein
MLHKLVKFSGHRIPVCQLVSQTVEYLSVGSPLAKNIFNSSMYQIPVSQCLKITYKLIKILTIDTPKIIQQKVWPFGQSAYQLAKWHL